MGEKLGILVVDRGLRRALDNEIVRVFAAITSFSLSLLLRIAEVVARDGGLLRDLADLVIELHLSELAAEELEGWVDGLDASFAL